MWYCGVRAFQVLREQDPAGVLPTTHAFFIVSQKPEPVTVRLFWPPSALLAACNWVIPRAEVDVVVAANSCVARLVAYGPRA